MDKKTNKIIKILKEFKKRVNRTIKIERMILFGSRARGDERKNSDVDIILVSKEFKNQKSFRRSPQIYLKWKSEYGTDIICLTPEELERKKSQIGIIKTALREGVEIW